MYNVEASHSSWGNPRGRACGFGSDADRARASTQGAGEPDNANHPREAVDQRRYRVAPRTLVRHQRPILAQSSKCIRHSRRPRKNRAPRSDASLCVPHPAENIHGDHPREIDAHPPPRVPPLRRMVAASRKRRTHRCPAHPKACRRLRRDDGVVAAPALNHMPARPSARAIRGTMDLRPLPGPIIQVRGRRQCE